MPPEKRSAEAIAKDRERCRAYYRVHKDKWRVLTPEEAAAKFRKYYATERGRLVAWRNANRRRLRLRLAAGKPDTGYAWRIGELTRQIEALDRRVQGEESQDAGAQSSAQ